VRIVDAHALHFTAMLCPDERTAILAETATRVYGL
jgi:hypothetical protein